MSAKKFFIAILIFACSFYSCNEYDPVSPISDTADNLDKFGAGSSGVTVLTRNIYVGGDVDQILQAASPEEIPFLVANVFQSIIETNFPERAQALAEEIQKNKPQLIGLQEVSLIRIQSPGDFLMGGSELAEDVVLDYLEILMMKLHEMGLNYEVVAKIENADVEMPMLTKFEPPFDEFDDVRLTDYDVILAKKGIKITNVVEKNYEARVVIDELGIQMPRGYTAVTAKIKGQQYRFVNTHLEDADLGGVLLDIQLAQAAELMSDLAGTSCPIILVGDFNSAAADGAAYELIKSTGDFVDTWLMNSDLSNPDGLTYGHDLDLRNETSSFWKRIDHVFVQNGIYKKKKISLQKVKSEVLGDEENDKTSSGLWPSDHGGVSASLYFNEVKERE